MTSTREFLEDSRLLDNSLGVTNSSKFWKALSKATEDMKERLQKKAKEEVEAYKKAFLEEQTEEVEKLEKEYIKKKENLAQEEAKYTKKYSKLKKKLISVQKESNGKFSFFISYISYRTN